MPKFQQNLAAVRDHFNRDALADICIMHEEDFGEAFDMRTTHLDIPGGRSSWKDDDADYFHFADRGSNVLAVAHLDTVVSRSQRDAHFIDTAGGPVVYSGALDDRLGAFIILDLLPSLGLKYDTLLTVGEESGMSTAEYFDKPRGKAYDWIIEFDRGGTDVVMYNYEDKDAIDAVRRTGAVVGQGIFSDICYMEHLGVKGFNWGVGYRDYHSVRSHAYLDDTMGMVARYLKFHQQNEGTYMPHVTEERYASKSLGRTFYSSDRVGGLWWDDEDIAHHADDDTALDADVVEPDLFDFDYTNGEPSLEDLQRLEERLDREAEQRRTDTEHLYADLFYQIEQDKRQDAEEMQPEYADLLSRFDR